MQTPVVTRVTVIPPYTLEVHFKDGFSRQVDMTDELWGEAFEQIRDPEFFAKAFVDPVSRTVAWPNGEDLSPEWLYEPDPAKWQKLVEESSRNSAQKQRKKQNARI
jgi:hypothetical protein